MAPKDILSLCIYLVGPDANLESYGCGGMSIASATLVLMHE